MSFDHDAVAALPVSGNASKALVRALSIKRFAYCLDASENAADLVAVDPDAGTVPLYLIQNSVLFQYDSTDTTTAADGITCLVTSDGKRYKYGDILTITGAVPSFDAFVFKGTIDCSANPNYPPASVGWTYKVSVAGKIGGASGAVVEAGDTIYCIADNIGGTQAAVGADFNIVQANIAGAVTGPGSSTSGNIATFNGTGGTVIQDGGKTLPTGAVVGTTDSQTLTNKTLTSPVIAAIVNTGTLTLPTSTDTLMGRATTDTLTNKTFDTAGAGNVFKINGTAISAVTGTGSDVLSASPTFTGTPAAPTASPGTNTTQIATTAFVTAAVVAATAGVASLNTLTGNVVISDVGGGAVSASGTSIKIAPPGGGLNKFINPGQSVDQRSTSASILTVTTSGAIVTDGSIVTPTGASVTAQRIANSGASTRSLHALKIIGNTSVTDVTWRQRIESTVAAPLAGQNVTVQAKIFNATGGSITPTITVKHPTTTADTFSSLTTDVSAVNLQACANSAWTTVAYTFSAPSGAANGIEVTIDFGNNFSANTKSVQITDLDCRATPGASTGLNANPPAPEIRLVGLEMLNCQRYYWRWNAGSANTGLCMMQALGSTSAWGTILDFPQTMFKAPTVAFSSAAHFDLRFTTGTVCNALDFTGTTSQTLKTDNGWTTGSAIGGTPSNGACIFSFANSASAWIDASAELFP